MEVSRRSADEVDFWQETYERHLSFKSIYAIAPLGKNVYDGVSVWVNFEFGGNLALDTLRSKKIGLDVDAKKLTPEMREVMRKTLSWKTPKGYCAILEGDISEPYRTALYAFHLNCVGRWKAIEEQKLKDDLQMGFRVFDFFSNLGLKDETSIHAGFANSDDRTYVLLPPSSTCKWSGTKGTTWGHSTYSEICNQSPNGEHDFKARTFYHYTTKLLTWDDFCRIVKARP